MRRAAAGRQKEDGPGRWGWNWIIDKNWFGFKQYYGADERFRGRGKCRDQVREDMKGGV